MKLNPIFSNEFRSINKVQNTKTCVVDVRAMRAVSFPENVFSFIKTACTSRIQNLPLYSRNFTYVSTMLVELIYFLAKRT